MKLSNPNPDEFIEMPTQGDTTLINFCVQTIEAALASGQGRVAIAQFGGGLGLLVGVAPIEVCRKFLADFHSEDIVPLERKK